MTVRLPDVSSSLPIKTGHLFIIGALIMAVITAFILMGMLSGDKNKATVEPKVKGKTIAIAARYVPLGKVLDRTDYKMAEWPEKYIPKDSIFTKAGDLTGRTATANLYVGEPIFKQKLSGDDSKGGLPVVIPEGMRAITLKASEIIGVGGFVRPGNYVDVLNIYKVNGEQVGSTIDGTFKVSETILQNALVLAASQDMVDQGEPDMKTPEALNENPIKEDKKKSKKKSKKLSAKDIEKMRKARVKERKAAQKQAKRISSVTLAVYPDQAEKLALAEDRGDLKLVLRPDGDFTVSELPGVTEVDMTPPAVHQVSSFNAPGPGDMLAEPDDNMVPVSMTSGSGNNVELIEGTKKSVVSF
ncbi:MAG: Flp pilus assembly protein CpaB [Vampirovibrio sp.]|nr:Flp pilus assembly protein CpaB [Vampirovibrio sp.]